MRRTVKYRNLLRRIIECARETALGLLILAYSVWELQQSLPNCPPLSEFCRQISATQLNVSAPQHYGLSSPIRCTLHLVSDVQCADDRPRVGAERSLHTEAAASAAVVWCSRRSLGGWAVLCSRANKSKRRRPLHSTAAYLQPTSSTKECLPCSVCALSALRRVHGGSSLLIAEAAWQREIIARNRRGHGVKATSQTAFLIKQFIWRIFVDLI